MKNKMKIKIENPCNEDWSKMTKAEQGRFCGSCQKNVIDFSKMSSREIKKILLNNNTQICGRFNRQQLKNFNAGKMEMPNPFNIRKWSIAAALAGLMAYPVYSNTIDMSQDFASIESVYKPETSTESKAEKENPEKDSILISGYVSDNKGQVIAGATVRIHNTTTYTTTDKNGKFILKALKKEDAQLIYAQYFSHRMKKDLKISCIKNIKNLKLEMEYYEQFHLKGVIHRDIRETKVKKK
jgi:hypothetical protein